MEYTLVGWKNNAPPAINAENLSNMDVAIYRMANKGFFSNGNMSTLGYTQFAQCKNIGYYEFGTSYLSSITDKPSDLTKAGICCVYKTDTLGFFTRIIYDISNNIWVSTGVSVSWIKVTPNDAYSYIYRGNIGTLGYTAFSQCTKNGFYSCPPSRLSLLADKPEGLSKLSICSVRNADNLGLTIQNITDADGNTWQRSIVYPNTTAEWVLVYNATVPVDVTGLKWCALGDSITQGYYSEFDETGNVIKDVYDISTSWTNICADICGFNLTNKAIGGTGYVAKTVSTNLNALELVDTLDFTEYDFVTLAYGINDYKYNKELSDVLVNLKGVITKIIGQNPICKIFVISPINCRTLNGSVFIDTNRYALDYKNDATIPYTLEELFDGIKQICEECCVELIDCTHKSVFNSVKLDTLLPDGVHPTREAHKVLAREMAAKIDIKN